MKRSLALLIVAVLFVLTVGSVLAAVNARPLRKHPGYLIGMVEIAEPGNQAQNAKIQLFIQKRSASGPVVVYERKPFFLDFNPSEYDQVRVKAPCSAIPGIHEYRTFAVVTWASGLDERSVSEWQRIGC